VTGDIIPAAWGNRVRDNHDYEKGRAGAGPIRSVRVRPVLGGLHHVYERAA